MSKTLTLSELAIVVTASNYDPSLMNPGFLSGSGIIPTDWQLSRQPVVSNRLSQLIYNNGVNIIAYPNRFMVTEALTTKSPSAVEIPVLVQRKCSTLRNIDYNALGINFRSYITCNEEYTVESNQYVSKNFLIQGEWLRGSKSPVKSGLSLMYEFEQSTLHLNINEATLQMPENEEVPIVLFTGNFNYELASDANLDKIERIKQILDNWQQDLEKYTEVVEKFLTTSSKVEMVTAI
jgi:hypothetical protein